MLRNLTVSLLFLAAIAHAKSARPEIPLWSKGAPGSEGITEKEVDVPSDDGMHRIKNVHNPSITVYLPAKEKATGAAFIICPGGGHDHLAIDLEGYDIAQRLSDSGIAAFVLKYRLAKTPGRNYKVEVHALQDTQRAIRTVRSRAQEWNIDPKRIGVMGFSAGGALVGLAGTRFDAGLPNATDAIDRQSSRPDFLVFGYPGLGQIDLNVTKDSPPAFFVHTNDDALSAERTAAVYGQFRRAGVPAEIHVYTHGGHGFGMRGRTPAFQQLPLAGWSRQLHEWMGDMGFLPQSQQRISTGPPKLEGEMNAGEGPAWMPPGDLYFVGNNRITRRHGQGAPQVFRDPAGGANGLLIDPQGRIVACEASARQITRTEKDGTITVLADRYEGKRFNSPNDLTIDAKGRIYFTDPRYGKRDTMEMRDEHNELVEGVYRIDAPGKVTRILAHELERPNGILVSPDNTKLYVADNNNNKVGGARKLWQFDLKPDGTVAPNSRKLIFDWGTARGPDGFKMDTAGRLYVAAGLNKSNPPFETTDQYKGGVYILTTAGELLEYIPIPRDEVTNCAFGGADLKTLFITAGGSLWSVPVSTPGRITAPAK